MPQMHGSKVKNITEKQIPDTDLAPRVKAAAIMFRDIAGRSPIMIKHKSPTLCPHCGDTLWLQSITADWFPYIHVDYTMKCQTCGKQLLHGQAVTKDTGLSLITWDSNPAESATHMQTIKTPRCPYKGHPYMTPTKIFGDWLPENRETNQITYQWKCPQCHLTHHQTHTRTHPTGTNQPLTDKEEKTIQERLRKLGYF